MAGKLLRYVAGTLRIAPFPSAPVPVALVALATGVALAVLCLAYPATRAAEAQTATTSTVVAWGDNYWGQTDVPSGLSGVRAISAGGDYSLALEEDGSVVAWGDNSYGRANVPPGVSDVTAIAAGFSHNLAVVTPVPPSPVEAFGATAEDGRVSLSWIDPSDSDLRAVRVLRSTTGPATSPTPNAQQTQVYDGAGESFTDTGLSNGTTYYYTAYARDDAGNWSTRTTARSTPSDLTPPETTIDSGPSGAVSDTAATFGFSSTEAGSTYRCSLDDASFATCVAGVSYSGLSEGSHVFEVKATDAAGNADPDPARRRWTVDTTLPNTAITDGPSGTVKSTSASFDFLASEPGSAYECSLDGAAFSGCTAPKQYSALSQGAHALQVRAVDAAGNVDATPASRSWTADTVAPSVTVVSPLGGATGVSASTSVSATYSEAMDAQSINVGTFTLKKVGSTTKVSATVGYDATKNKAILNPKSNLRSGTTYVARVTTAAYDKAGNPLDQDTSATGLQSRSWTFQVR